MIELAALSRKHNVAIQFYDCEDGAGGSVDEMACSGHSESGYGERHGCLQWIDSGDWDWQTAKETIVR